MKSIDPTKTKQPDATEDRLREVLGDVWAARDAVRGLHGRDGLPNPTAILARVPQHVPSTPDELRGLVQAIGRAQGAFDIEAAARTGTAKQRLTDAGHRLDRAFARALRILEQRETGSR